MAGRICIAQAKWSLYNFSYSGEGLWSLVLRESLLGFENNTGWLYLLSTVVRVYMEDINTDSLHSLVRIFSLMVRSFLLDFQPKFVLD